MLTWMMLIALTAWGQTEMSSTTTTWAGNYTVSNDVTINGTGNPLVRLAGNTIININDDATLTVNGLIDLYGVDAFAGEHTLTINGGGTLNINSSATYCISGTDCTLIINGGTVNLTGSENTLLTAYSNVIMGGGNLFTNKLINSLNTFTIADGKYYKDETTGKRYKGELTIDDKEEIQGHNLVETTDEFYYLTATENVNVTEIWTYIGTGVDTSLPEKRIDVSPNASVALNIGAKLGYEVTGVTVKDSNNSIVTVNHNTNTDDWEFKMPQKDVNVTIETGEATYPVLPLTWNTTYTEGIHTFEMDYAIYTFTPTQSGYYKFAVNEDDVSVYVYDDTTNHNKLESVGTKGYAMTANTKYYVNLYPDSWADPDDFTLTVTVEGPTAMEVTAHKATYNGVPKYWATFYHPLFNYQLPEGAMAFYMKSDHALYLVGDDGNIIPQKTPVVIVADVSTEDTINLSLTPVDTSNISVTDNILQGTAAAKTLEEGESVYVMGKPEDNLGFYKYTGTEIPANKAYYKE